VAEGTENLRESRRTAMLAEVKDRRFDAPQRQSEPGWRLVVRSGTSKSAEPAVGFAQHVNIGARPDLDTAERSRKKGPAIPG
jgi:hypothetical protein